MNQSLLTPFGNPFQRVEQALSALQQGNGVLVVDDEDRENEGDLIFSAEKNDTATNGTDDPGMFRYCLPMPD